MQAWWTRRALSRALAALREAEEEPGGGQTMVITFTEGERVFYTGIGKFAGLRGTVTRQHPKKVSVRFDGNAYDSCVDPKFLRLDTSAERGGDTSSSNNTVGSFVTTVSGTMSDAADTADEFASHVMGTTGPPWFWPTLWAAFFVVAAGLQFFAADLFGACATGKTGEFDATQKPCRLWTDGYFGLSADCYTYVLVFLATLGWQNTQLVQNEGKVLGRTITCDTLWRVVHMSYTLKCVLECALNDYRNQWFTPTLLVLVITAAWPARGNDPVPETYSASSDEVVTVDDPAWCAPYYPFVTAIQLLVLLSLSSLADEGEVMACICTFLFVRVTKCRSFRRTVYARMPDPNDLLQRLRDKVLPGMNQNLTVATQEDDTRSRAESKVDSLINSSQKNTEELGRLRAAFEARTKVLNWQVFRQLCALGTLTFCVNSSTLHQALGIVEVGTESCRWLYWNDQTNEPGILSESSLSGFVIDGMCQLAEPIIGGVITQGTTTSFSINHPFWSFVGSCVVKALGFLIAVPWAWNHKVSGFFGWVCGFCVGGHCCLYFVQSAVGAKGLALEFAIHSVRVCWPRALVIASRVLFG
jgi:hypothetical protein